MREEVLQSLAAAARHGSVAGAGRALRRSPSTVSRQLAALEREVGVVLFTRGRNGATLNGAGQAYAVHAEEALAAMAAARAAASGPRDDEPGGGLPCGDRPSRP